MTDTPSHQTTAGLNRRQRANRRFVFSNARADVAWWLPGWESVCAAYVRMGLLTREGRYFRLTPAGRQVKQEYRK